MNSNFPNEAVKLLKTKVDHFPTHSKAVNSLKNKPVNSMKAVRLLKNKCVNELGSQLRASDSKEFLKLAAVEVKQCH
jgi:hypothetical protein